MSVFLDHASTTALRPCAKVALIDALEMLGNPSSVHCQGRSTRELLEASRTEHHAVIDPIQWLGKHQNPQVLFVEHFANGMIDMDCLKALVNQHGQKGSSNQLDVGK